MQQRRTNSYSNVQTQLEIDLEDERQALLEDQKSIRIRAQKLSTETNRRRKALEEKRREEEEKEQKFREEILQQRKIKLQEATEKFQRAHLPLSQRRRAVYVHKKTPPRLEDALEQIQGSSPFYYLHSHRNPQNNRTSDTPSTLGNGIWNRKPQTPSKPGSERIFQERNITQFDSNHLYFQHKLEEAQRLLEEHHLNNIQTFHQEVEQLERAESLSSLDSLEEEADTSKNLHKAVSEILLSTQHYGNESVNRLNSHSGHISSSEMNVDKITTDKNPQMREQIMLFSHMAADQAGNFTQNGTPSENKFSSSTQNEENGLSKMNPTENRAAMSEYRDSTTSNLVVRPSRAWATPDPTPREAIQNCVPQENKETIQHSGIYTKPTVSKPLVTSAILPSTEQESSGSNGHDGTHVNAIMSKYSDNINSVAGTDILVRNDHIKYADTANKKLWVHENTSLNSTMANKGFLVVEDQKDHILNGTSVHADSGSATQYKNGRHTIGVAEGTRLLKSILKKDSKYENGFNNNTLHFGNKSAPYIRDSIELTKEKVNIFENQKTGNKKLRWLDEIDKIMTGKKMSGSNKNFTGNLTSSENTDSVNLQGYALTPNSTLVEPPSRPQSSVHSTGYHFTKQAWIPSKGEETSPVGYNQSRNSPPRVKTKVVKRPKSAKTQSTLMLKNRKGIIIRPQSATETSRILKSQGKLMMPHPPPKPGSGIQSSPHATEGMNHEYSNNTHGNTSSNGMSPSNQVFTKDATANVIYSQNFAHPSGSLTTQPYNSTGVESSTKSFVTLNSERPFVLQESLQSSSKRHHVYGENGLRLDHTPTDEEIAVLWHGVRSALSHKNVAAGDFNPGDLPSNLQLTRPNLSHVIIDGNLLSNMKSFSRINGLYSPAINGYSTLARRKQILDCTENKRRALLEQRRKPLPTNWRSMQNLHTMKISPFPSAFEPGQTSHGVPNSNEVTDSTVQFMLAENLVETSATDADILAAMQAMQANKQSFLMHKAHNTGLSALSIEEQRLLQSLDRLNQRLHNVHETIGKTPTIKSPLNIQQYISQPSDVAVPSQRIRSMSADPRTRLQRRF
ncbi:centrosomal protein of 126 kDa [Discoglossus pictus]